MHDSEAWNCPEAADLVRGPVPRLPPSASTDKIGDQDPDCRPAGRWQASCASSRPLSDQTATLCPRMPRVYSVDEGVLTSIDGNVTLPPGLHRQECGDATRLTRSGSQRSRRRRAISTSNRWVNESNVWKTRLRHWSQGRSTSTESRRAPRQRQAGGPTIGSVPRLRWVTWIAGAWRTRWAFALTPGTRVDILLALIVAEC